MALFEEHWKMTVAALGEGLDDVRMERLKAGLEYFRGLMMDMQGSLERSHFMWLNKSVMPIWTKIVWERKLLHIESTKIIDELYSFIETKAGKAGSDFTYDVFLSSKSTDPEADYMMECCLDFQDHCAALYGSS